MIYSLVGIISAMTSLSAVVISPHWRYDTRGEWRKHSAGRTLLFLMVAIAISSGTLATAVITWERTLFRAFFLMSSVLLFVAVAMFGHSRFAIQKKYSSMKGKK